MIILGGTYLDGIEVRVYVEDRDMVESAGNARVKDNHKQWDKIGHRCSGAKKIGKTLR